MNGVLNYWWAWWVLVCVVGSDGDADDNSTSISEETADRSKTERGVA